MDLGTVDSVVGSDVEVVSISGDSVVLGNVAVGLVLRRSNNLYLTVELSLLNSLLCPNASLQVSSLSLEKVSGNLEELSRSTTTYEEYCVVIGNVEKVTPKLLNLCHYALPAGSTV